MTIYYLRRRPCHKACAGGRKCTLDNDPQHPHTLCVCADPFCVCHAAAAYDLERVTIRGVAQYRRVARMDGAAHATICRDGEV